MARKVGRPRKYDYKSIKRVVRTYRNHLKINNKIIPRSHFLWEIIAEEAKINLRSLHFYIKKNSNKFRDDIFKEDNVLENDSEICFDFDVSKIPVLQNGLLSDLDKILLGTKLVRVVNTCAFDSVFQVFLAACAEYECLLNFIKIHNDNSFFNMLKSNVNRKFSTNIYQERANILSKIFKIKSQGLHTGIVNCVTAAYEMYEHLVKKSVDITEKKSCFKCGHSEISRKTVLIINSNQIKLPTIIYETLVKNRRCSVPDCGGDTFKLTESCGRFIGCDVMVSQNFKMNISEIAQNLIIIINSEKVTYSLLGFINFYPSSTGLAHFTGFYKNKQGVWTEFNDMKIRSILVGQNCAVSPHLVIYGQI